MIKYRTAHPDRYELLKDFARTNRKNQTLAEAVIWEELRAKRTGTRFVRQHIIGDYIVDLLAIDHNLVIEIDGGYHAERQQQEDDKVRTEWLESVGYKVIRFSNEEVLYETNKVLEKIQLTLQ